MDKADYTHTRNLVKKKTSAVETKACVVIYIVNKHFLDTVLLPKDTF